MAHYGYFCTQYLLTQHCKDTDRCLFPHVSPVDIDLDEPLPNGSNYVKGHYLGRPTLSNSYLSDDYDCHLNSLRYQDTKRRYPLFAETKFSENSSERASRIDSKNPTPSTSKFNKSSSASTSNQTLAQSEDESCLGATALISVPNPQFKMNHVSHPITSLDKQLETENRRNLGSSKGSSGGGGGKLKLNIDAPEFVPRARFNATSNYKKRLCPYAERDGLCKYPPGECTYLHGDMCDLCARPALHPYNDEQRKKHTTDCIRRHERDMEIAFAVARSKEKICGICFEVVMQKNSEEQRFGILPSCNHCFCLTCIRRWRQSKQFDNKIIRSCPECRIPSDFVCPSAYWVDTKEDKDKVIDKYKSALAKKDCKYFKHGRGHCPFGNKCFYRHCLQNGRKIDVGPPPSSNVNHVDSGVEIIQRLLLLSRFPEHCPLEDLSDEMELHDILEMLDLSDIFSSDSDDDYWSD